MGINFWEERFGNEINSATHFALADVFVRVRRATVMHSKTESDNKASQVINSVYVRFVTPIVSFYFFEIAPIPILIN